MRRLTDPFEYYWNVLVRALRDTWRHIFAHVLVGFVLFLLGFLFKCASLPSGQECKATDFEAGVVAVAIYAGTILLFNVVMGPVRLHRELTKLVESMRVSAPWYVTATTDHAGVTLVLKAKSHRTKVDRVRCIVHLPGHDANMWVDGPLTIGTDDAQALKIRYPDQFTDASWPLGDGRYQCDWNIFLSEYPHPPADQWAFTGEFYIKKRGARRR